LEPEERFRLTLAAFARGDSDECERLETSCPRKVYSMPDAAVGDPVDAALFFTIVFERVLRCVELAWSQVEAARAFLDGYQRGVDAVLNLTAGPPIVGGDEEALVREDDADGNDDEDSRALEEACVRAVRGGVQRVGFSLGRAIRRVHALL
jgi:hypothetical protein